MTEASVTLSFSTETTSVSSTLPTAVTEDEGVMPSSSARSVNSVQPLSRDRPSPDDATMSMVSLPARRTSPVSVSLTRT